MADRMISDVLAKPDAALEMTLRPSLFSDFTGQANVKERLEIAVQAAKKRGEALDHLLFSGPPGLGKPRWPISSPRAWAPASSAPAAPQSKRPATWPDC